MKRFFTAFSIVFAREFKETLRSKPFRIISVFLAILLILIAAAGIFLAPDSDDAQIFAGDFTDGGASQGNTVTYYYSLAVDDRTGSGLASKLSDELPAVRLEEKALDEAIAAGLIADGECDACVVLLSPTEFDLYAADGDAADIGESVRMALDTIERTDALAQLGVDEAQAKDILHSSGAWYTIHTVDTDGDDPFSIGMYLYNYVVIILMFLVIGLYGQMVATRVATEKSSRTMEVLATSVSPSELLCGKVMGVGAAGLLQIVVFALAAAGIIRGVLFSSPMMSVVADQLLNISAGNLACLVIYFVLGFALYAFIFGALGSMVSQIEDLSGTASLPLYLFMAGYFISLTGMAGTEPGTLIRVASYIPFWSPVAMFSRMSAENVPAHELAISIALLALTTVLMAWLSARIYRSGMLRYGKPPRIKEIISAAREGTSNSNKA